MTIIIFYQGWELEMSRLTWKNVVSIYYWAQIFWWILAGYSHIYQNRWCGWVWPLSGAKSFCFEISPSFLLCSWDVWGEVEEDDDQVTQSSGLLLLHILLFLSFREIQECSKCTSEGEPQSGPIMKRKRFFFGLPVSFYRQRYNSVCQKLIWACLT